MSYILSTFRPRVSEPCASVSELLVALRWPQKNTPLEFWSMYLVDFVDFCRFRGPLALCVCVAAACGASATSEKTLPWIFGTCIVDFVDFLSISGPSQPCASVSQLPAALRRPQRKHAPGFWEHVSCEFCHLLSISAPPSPVRLCRSSILGARILWI